jgi:SAM-dependent methyltransferase
MISKEKDKESVKEYYDQEAFNYIRKYSESYESYPTYLLRLNLAKQCIQKRNIKSILDCGSGSCGPMLDILKSGCKIKGFDLSPEMVKNGKAILKENGYNENLVEVGDLESGIPFGDEKFDAALAFGVFPHIKSEVEALKKIGTRINDHGYVYVSFRNDLFALFSMNEYSYHFYANKLTNSESMVPAFKEEWNSFLENKFMFDKNKIKVNPKLEYKDIYATFNNPLTIEKDLFEPAGFEVKKILFHHYHLVPPKLGESNPELFRKLSLDLENPEDWKGYFTASTFLVEAQKVK